MSEHKPHITSYKTQLAVLFSLIILTVISVAITHIELGALNTLAAMMHLKFDNKLYMIFAILVITTFLLVLLVTFFDYLYR